MPTEMLADFLKSKCKEMGLSLRALSVKAGLSPSTLRNIINRNYEPTIFTLNRLADFLGVKRQYIWYLAGLLEDMDYSTDEISDPLLRHQFIEADALTETDRILVVNVLKSLIDELKRRPDLIEPTKSHQ